MALRAGIRLAHDDEDRAVGVHGPGDPPLAPIDDVVVAVAHDRRRDIGGIRRGHVRLRHGERRADLAGEQRIQPAALLLIVAREDEHLHVARVRRGTVEGRGCERRAAAHDLGQRGVLQVGEPRTVWAGRVGRAAAVRPPGEEQIPQPRLTGLRLQVEQERHAAPCPAVGQRIDLLEVGALLGVDVRVHERRQALAIGLRRGVEREVHVPAFLGGAHLLTGVCQPERQPTSRRT